MTRPHCVAAIAGTLLVALLATSAVFAQAGPPSSAAPTRPFGIALLDVNHIFKSHRGFQARMDKLKGDVQQAEDQLKQRSDAIRKDVQRLADLQKTNPGSAQYKQLEEDVARRRADIQVKMQMQRKEFLQEEADIYYIVYREIQQEVYNYAVRNNIALVLRFNGDPIDKEQPEDVLRGVNSDVVWYAPGMDITAVIRDRLNARYGGVSQTTSNPYPSAGQGRHTVPPPGYRQR